MVKKFAIWIVFLLIIPLNPSSVDSTPNYRSVVEYKENEDLGLSQDVPVYSTTFASGIFLITEELEANLIFFHQNSTKISQKLTNGGIQFLRSSISNDFIHFTTKNETSIFLNHWNLATNQVEWQIFEHEHSSDAIPFKINGSDGIIILTPDNGILELDIFWSNLSLTLMIDLKGEILDLKDFVVEKIQTQSNQEVFGVSLMLTNSSKYDQINSFEHVMIYRLLIQDESIVGMVILDKIMMDQKLHGYMESTSDKFIFSKLISLEPYLSYSEIHDDFFSMHTIKARVSNVLVGVIQQLSQNSQLSKLGPIMVIESHPEEIQEGIYYTSSSISFLNEDFTDAVTHQFPIEIQLISVLSSGMDKLFGVMIKSRAGGEDYITIDISINDEYRKTTNIFLKSFGISLVIVLTVVVLKKTLQKKPLKQNKVVIKVLSKIENYLSSKRIEEV